MNYLMAVDCKITFLPRVVQCLTYYSVWKNKSRIPFIENAVSHVFLLNLARQRNRPGTYKTGEGASGL